MVIRRLYERKIAQASYLVGCNATGEAIVIDPNRNIGQYLEAAKAEGLAITAVTETHIHADYLSGARELAKVAGAKLFLSDEGGPDWRYDYRDEPNVVLVKDGSSIRIGNVRLDVLHTPGHTPEHLTFLLTDEPASDRPMGAFTGDFIFVGDVGRPDLLERAANIKGTMETGGRQLYQSLQRFGGNSDGLLIWPGHGAGSACGKSLGGAPVTSLGYERVSNWAFKTKSEGEFVGEVLSGQPDPPPYFAMMKALNKQGPADSRFGRDLPKCDASRLGGSQVLDIRDRHRSKMGYLQGSIMLSVNSKTFLKYAGWLMGYDRPIVLVADDEDEARSATRDLALIGLDQVEGWIPGGDLTQVTATELIQGRDLANWAGMVLDVRWPDEYADGHVPGAVNVPLGHLASRLEQVPKTERVALVCETGNRSQTALSLLARAGFCNLCNVEGGYDEYRSTGGRVEAAACPASN